MHQVNVHPRSVPIIRAMLPVVFILGGLGNFVLAKHTIQRLVSAPLEQYIPQVASPSFLIYASGAVILICGLLFIAGIKSRWNAWILTLMLVPISGMALAGDPANLGPLIKNIAFQGGLLVLILNEFPNPKKQF